MLLTTYPLISSYTYNGDGTLQSYGNTRCLMIECLLVLWKEVAMIHFKRRFTVPEFACKKWDKPRQLDCSPRNEVRIFRVWSRMMGTAEWHLICWSHRGILTRLIEVALQWGIIRVNCGYSDVVTLRRGCTEVLLQQGSTNFLQILGSYNDSRRQKCDTNQDSYWWPANITR